MIKKKKMIYNIQMVYYVHKKITLIITLSAQKKFTKFKKKSLVKILNKFR